MKIVFQFLLFLLCCKAIAQPQYFQGGIVRGDTSQRNIYLVFTGHEFADGDKVITRTLRKTKTSASFFFTGDFYRNYPKTIKKLRKNGHYLGPHSDQHLLYNAWENRDSLLVSETEFKNDLLRNFDLINAPTGYPRFFLPAYEWYNQTIADWSSELGFHLINFSSGTRSNADYTTPDMKNYLSSDAILKSIFQYEQSKGMNGFILLIHFGTAPERKDKLYLHLDEIINYLKSGGYTFKRIDNILD